MQSKDAERIDTGRKRTSPSNMFEEQSAIRSREMARAAVIRAARDLDENGSGTLAYPIALSNAFEIMKILWHLNIRY